MNYKCGRRDFFSSKTKPFIFQIDVVEVQVKLTSAMLACQTALLDLINACIKELKRCTTAVSFKIILNCFHQRSSYLKFFKS